MNTQYSQLPCTTARPGELLPAAVERRGRVAVVRVQWETWMFLERLVDVDPELRAELEAIRAEREVQSNADRS